MQEVNSPREQFHRAVRGYCLTEWQLTEAKIKIVASHIDRNATIDEAVRAARESSKPHNEQ